MSPKKRNSYPVVCINIHTNDEEDEVLEYLNGRDITTFYRFIIISAILEYLPLAQASILDIARSFAPYTDKSSFFLKYFTYERTRNLLKTMTKKGVLTYIDNDRIDFEKRKSNKIDYFNQSDKDWFLTNLDDEDYAYRPELPKKREEAKNNLGYQILIDNALEFLSSKGVGHQLASNRTFSYNTLMFYILEIKTRLKNKQNSVKPLLDKYFPGFYEYLESLFDGSPYAFMDSYVKVVKEVEISGFSKINYEIIDLTHEITEKPPCTLYSDARNQIDFKKTRGEALGLDFFTTFIKSMYLNYGTHIDFPGHLDFDWDKKISDFALDNFIAPGIIIDISEKVTLVEIHTEKSDGLLLPSNFKTNEDYVKVVLELIRNLEVGLDYFKEITADIDITNKAILFYTGLDKYWRYQSFQGWDYIYFLNPYPSYELCEYLVKNKVRIVGTDCLQVENPAINIKNSKPYHGFPQKYREKIDEMTNVLKEKLVHSLFLDKHIMMVENLTGLESLLNKEFLFFAPPLKFGSTNINDNSLTRAFAITLKQSEQNE